jgi:abhydrolase domain-containing protein 12
VSGNMILIFNAENQVTPFTITTPDGESLHAWHILPRALYAERESEIVEQKLGKVNEFKDTLAYKLLTSDSDSKLIINCKSTALKRPY